MLQFAAFFHAQRPDPRLQRNVSNEYWRGAAVNYQVRGDRQRALLAMRRCFQRDTGLLFPGVRDWWILNAE